MTVFRARGDAADVVIYPSKHRDAVRADPSIHRTAKDIEDVTADFAPEHGAVEGEVLMAPAKAEQAFGAGQRAILRFAADVFKLETVGAHAGGK